MFVDRRAPGIQGRANSAAGYSRQPKRNPLRNSFGYPVREVGKSRAARWKRSSPGRNNLKERQRGSRAPLLLKGAALASLLGWLGSACASETAPRAEASAPQGAALVVGADELPAGDADEAHAQLFTRERYPSATQCKACHPTHYREWAASPHSYAQISPVFNAMSARILKLSNGTLGDFCIRCHTPVGMALGEPIFAPNSERDPVSLEGVTCIVCHRVDKAFGKNSGRTPLVKGSLFAKVFGPRPDDENQRVIHSPDEFGPVVTEPGEVGRQIHAGATFFEPISSPGFCGTCHDVTLIGGLRFEEAFSEYKHSPAARRGETCQDCHMGKIPGVASGYFNEPAAHEGGVATQPRKRSSHNWPGPDYSVVHPGIFPHNPDAKALASVDEWLQFDWKAGWGTDAFEDSVDMDAVFPERWDSIDDRYEAREILELQLEHLAQQFEAGTQLLERGYQLGEIELNKSDPSAAEALRFGIEVSNGIDGHNVPTGFIAERLVFLQVTVTDAQGQAVYRSGDLDPNGDVRDSHSAYVHAGKLEEDSDLFNLQSKFVIQNVYGGESEQILAVNNLVDPLPYIRPDPTASVLLGRPVVARIHRFGIESNGKRTAPYRVPASKLTGPGEYTINVRLIAGMVPSNLINEIQSVGFDYGMSPREVADAVLDGHRILHERTMKVTLR